jgi:hypothetical protein
MRVGGLLAFRIWGFNIQDLRFKVEGLGLRV